MNWEVILWTSVTLGVFIAIAGILVSIFSAKNMRKQTKVYAELHQNMRPGMKILFCGGIYGKIVKMDGDMVDVEIGKNNIITISRYAVQQEVPD